MTSRLPLAVFAAIVLSGCTADQTPSPKASTNTPDSSSAQAPSAKPADTPPPPDDTKPKVIDTNAVGGDTTPKPPAKFAPPDGYDEVEAGLKQSEDDLLQQGLSVVDRKSPASLAVAVIAESTAKKSDGRPDAAKDLAAIDSNAPDPSPYVKALVLTARSASSKKPQATELGRLKTALDDDLKGLDGCALPYFALTVWATRAGEKDLAVASRAEAQRRADQE